MKYTRYMKRNFFRGYIAYLKDNPEGYWFKRRLFGWGWTPATREGWFLTIGFLLAILFLATRVDESSTDEEALKLVVLPLFALTAVFLLIVYKKGEKPRWTWGLPKDDEDSDSETE